MLETTDWWPEVPLEKWRCTAAMARMHGLPGGLDKLCKIFKVKDDEAKDKRYGLDQILLQAQERWYISMTGIRIRPNGPLFYYMAGRTWRRCARLASYSKVECSAPHVGRWHLNQRMNDARRRRRLGAGARR